MSISPIGNSNTVGFDPNDDSREKASNDEPKKREFDFAGAAYAMPVLPHGILSGGTSSRPTAADVLRDATALQTKLTKLGHDLQSPGMREWASKHWEATKTGTALGAKIAAVTFAILLLREKGAAALATIEGMSRATSAGSQILSLLGDFKTFAHQLGEEHEAAKAAHPDVVRCEHDLIDVMAAGAKLAIDMRKLGGA